MCLKTGARWNLLVNTVNTGVRTRVSSTVSYYLKSDKIWILFLDLVGNLEADPGEGPGEGGGGPSRYFWTKLRPEVSKNFF